MPPALAGCFDADPSRQPRRRRQRPRLAGSFLVGGAALADHRRGTRRDHHRARGRAVRRTSLRPDRRAQGGPEPHPPRSGHHLAGPPGRRGGPPAGARGRAGRRRPGRRGAMGRARRSGGQRVLRPRAPAGLRRHRPGRGHRRPLPRPSGIGAVLVGGDGLGGDRLRRTKQHAPTPGRSGHAHRAAPVARGEDGQEPAPLRRRARRRRRPGGGGGPTRCPWRPPHRHRAGRRVMGRACRSAGQRALRSHPR